MQSLDTDVQAVGGGYGGMGFGNMGYNPLLWLITLGFLRGGNGGFFGGDGNAAGTAAVANTTGIAENSAKIDCLQQGQSFLQNSLNGLNSDNQFRTLSAEISALAVANRDTQDTIFRETNALGRALADCCCEVQKGQQAIETSIALQTTALTANANNNTQKILDNLCEGRIQALRTENDALQRQLGIAETVKQITQACGCCGGSTTVAAAAAP